MKKLLAAILFMCAAGANAGVTYQWQTTSFATDHAPLDIRMTIVFNDAAVSAGSVDFVSGECSNPSQPAECSGPSPVESFFFSAGTQSDIYLTSDSFVTAGNFILFMISGEFSNRLFIGDVHAWTKDTQIVIYRGDIAFLESSVPGDICQLGEECQDDRGVIQAVPEPSTISLLGLSLGALWLGRRRLKRTTQSCGVQRSASFALRQHRWCAARLCTAMLLRDWLA